MTIIIRELLNRQQVLAIYGLSLLTLTPFMLALQLLDSRTFDDVDVWAKPTKFVVSVAVFALTTAWYFGYVQPMRRRIWQLRGVVAIILVAGSFEIIYISWQAAHGLASHFNHSSVFYEIMYGLMGVGALSLVLTQVPLAWEIWRRPVLGLRPEYVAAVVIGLVLCCVLGGGFGIYMSQQPSHTVGSVGGHSLIFGWNRLGGDLRIAHFLGIHSQQAIPLLGLLVTRISQPLKYPTLIAGSLGYSTVALAIFVQAITGHALLPNLL